jgi:pectate lyase
MDSRLQPPADGGRRALVEKPATRFRHLAASLLFVLLQVAILCFGSLAGPATPAGNAEDRSMTIDATGWLPADRPLEGFGAQTEGGAGGEAYVVANLNDSGAGSLRDALSESNRMITFSVGGTIDLQSNLRIINHHVTIDGRTAPPPGITLANATLLFVETAPDTAHDIIVRNIRIIDSYDNLAIGSGAWNIVIDHCSFRRAEDGNIDLYNGACDVTIQWCILGDNGKNSLIRNDCLNLSLHHNLYVHGAERNPQVQDDCTVVDMVNNVIFDWAGNYGTRFRIGTTGNLVKNFYAPGENSDVSDAVILEAGSGVYSEGNVIPPQSDDDGTADMRWNAPAVTEMTPEEALLAVLEEAGTFPRDVDDLGYVADVIAAIFGTASSEGRKIPKEYAARPNPASAGTTVAYALAEEADVRFEVYDGEGRRVRTVFDGRQGPGSYSLAWDGRDERGERVASGVYFLRVVAGDEPRVHKVFVIR